MACGWHGFIVVLGYPSYFIHTMDTLFIGLPAPCNHLPFLSGLLVSFYNPEKKYIVIGNHPNHPPKSFLICIHVCVLQTLNCKISSSQVRIDVNGSTHPCEVLQEYFSTIKVVRINSW